MDVSIKLPERVITLPLFFAVKNSPMMKKNETSTDKMQHKITSAEVNEWEDDVIVAPSKCRGNNK